MLSSPGQPHLSEDDLAAAAAEPILRPPARRQAIDAHLSSCPDCRRRLTEMREVRAILRHRYQAVHDPRAWNSFTVRVTEQRRRRRARLPVALATAALFALLAVLVIAQPDWRSSLSGGMGVPSRTVVAVTPTPNVLRGVAPSDPAVSAIAFTAVEPPLLPFDLVQTQRSILSSNYLELLYENESGLAILVAQSPVGSTPPPLVNVGEAGESTIVIDDTTIHALNDPWPETVSAMFWERDGLRFELLVTGTPPNGLSRSDATQFAEALFARQDDQGRQVKED